MRAHFPQRPANQQLLLQHVCVTKATWRCVGDTKRHVRCSYTQATNGIVMTRSLFSATLCKLLCHQPGCNLSMCCHKHSSSERGHQRPYARGSSCVLQSSCLPDHPFADRPAGERHCLLRPSQSNLHFCSPPSQPLIPSNVRMGQAPS